MPGSVDLPGAQLSALPKLTRAGGRPVHLSCRQSVLCPLSEWLYLATVTRSFLPQKYVPRGKCFVLF